MKINKIEKRLSKADFLAIKDDLEKLDESELKGLKCPLIALCFSIFFGIFGIDRVYKGDLKLGVVKFLLGFCSCIVFFKLVSVFLQQENIPAFLDAHGLPSLLSLVVYDAFSAKIIILISLCWWLIDIFLVYYGVKKENFIKIKALLKG